MDNRPKVTVVTITFNLVKAGREDNVRQCIESIHSQDYPFIEHIVIDGASSDGTLDLLRPYEEKGWLHVYSEPDKGIYDAMNKGIARSTGEFIAFLNSDDFWHDPRGVSASVEALEKENADFSFAPVYYLKEHDVREGILDDVIGAFHTRMPCSHQSLFVRRRIFERIGGFNDKYRSSADYDFVLRMCLSGAEYVRVPLNFTSFRHTGLSAGTAELGDSECMQILHSNLSAVSPYTEKNAREHFLSFVIPEETYTAIRNKVSPKIRDAMDREAPEKLDGGLLKIRRVPRIAFCPGAGMPAKRKFSLTDRIWGFKLLGVPLFSSLKKPDHIDVFLFHRLPLLRAVCPDPAAKKMPFLFMLQQWALLHWPSIYHPAPLKLARLGEITEPVPTMPICFLGKDFSVRRMYTTPMAFHARSSRFVVSEKASKRLDTAFTSSKTEPCFIDFPPDELTYHVFHHKGTAPLEFSKMPFLKNAKGFSVPEPWGCWSDGPEVRFVFHTDLTGQNLRIHFDVSPALYDCHPCLNVKVIVNGHSRAHWHFSANRHIDTTLVLPAKQIPKSGKLAFEFQIDDPHSPAFWGRGTDPRRLGLAFSSMWLEPVS